MTKRIADRRCEWQQGRDVNHSLQVDKRALGQDSALCRSGLQSMFFKKKVIQVFLVGVFFCAPFGARSAKAQKKPRVDGRTVIGTVTIDAEKTTPSFAPLPKETDPWTELSAVDDGVRVMFPGKAEDVVRDSVGPVETFDVVTRKARYGLAIRHLGQLARESDGEAFLDERIADVFGSAGLAENRVIEYAGRTGREFVSIEKGRHLIARAFVLNGKLVIVFVSVPSVDFDPAFKVWMKRFFDSMRVDLPVLRG